MNRKLPGVLLVFFLVLITYAPKASYSRHHQLTGEEITQVLENKLLNYDRRVRPYAGIKPVTVVISLYAIRLYSFSELNKDFKIDFYFRQEWSDPRLEYESHNIIRSRSDAKIKVGHEVVNRIWTPDTFFPSDKSGYRASITVPNAFLVIRPNGTLFMSQRFTTHTDCEGGIAFFPMDRHKCSLEFESYGFGTDDIVYKWIREKIRVGVGMTLESFDLVGLEESESVVSLSTGNYSRLGVKFIIDRKTTGFIWRFYMPLTFIWLLSITPFYFPIHSMLVRFVLSITSLVSSVILVTIISVDFIPKSGSLTALDVFNATALTLIVISFTLVLYQILILDRANVSPGNNIQNESDQCSVIKTATTISLTNPGSSSVADAVSSVKLQDSIARKVLTLILLVFHLVYWVTVTVAPQLLVAEKVQ